MDLFMSSSVFLMLECLRNIFGSLWLHNIKLTEPKNGSLEYYMNHCYFCSSESLDIQKFIQALRIYAALNFRPSTFQELSIAFLVKFVTYLNLQKFSQFPTCSSYAMTMLIVDQSMTWVLSLAVLLPLWHQLVVIALLQVV